MPENIPQNVNIWPAVVGGAGICINLLWNLFNSRAINKNRKDAIKLEEFRRLRNSVDIAIGNLRTERTGLSSLELSSDGLDVWTGLVASQSQQISIAYRKLSMGLSDLDISKFADGADWRDSMVPFWDQFIDTVGRAYNPVLTESERRHSIILAGSKLDEMIALVNTKCDATLNNFT